MLDHATKLVLVIELQFVELDRVSECQACLEPEAGAPSSGS